MNIKKSLQGIVYGLQKKIYLLVVTCALIVALVGCGYTTRSMISNEFKTIYVEQFVNKIDITKEADAGSKYKIYKPMLETIVSKAVINRFLFDGNLKPVSKDKADLILKGELVDFKRDPLRYSDSDEVEEYRVNIIVNLSLWDNHKNTLIWEEKSFTGDTTYFTTGASAISDDKAINNAVDDLARRIVERIVEQW